MADESRAPRIVRVETSTAFLPEAGALRRLPRTPRRKRPESFQSQFEDRALFYDCFAYGEDRIVLVGPPPLNLRPFHESARYLAEPSGKALAAQFHPSRSTMITELTGVPQGTSGLTIEFAGERFELAVQESMADAFAGRRVMFTMNKDNPLDWIELWARWHQRLHGIDAIIVFDNGSQAYRPRDVEERLAAIEGIERVAVISWPYRYGPVDPAVLFHPYWPNFLQVASFRITISRLAARAAGILNCDIDELVGRDGDRDAFAALEQSPDGLVVLKGTWVETAVAPDAAESPYHLRYRYRHKNPLKAICANKWVLDPKRGWAQDFGHTPMMHRIYGVSRGTSNRAPRLPFFHFKAINTNWKEERNRPQANADGAYGRLASLDEQVERYLSGHCTPK